MLCSTSFYSHKLHPVEANPFAVPLSQHTKVLRALQVRQPKARYIFTVFEYLLLLEQVLSHAWRAPGTALGL